MGKFAVLLLAAPLALVACGSSSNARVDAESVAYVRHAGSKTAALASEHMTVSLRMNIAGEEVWVDISGDYSDASDKGNFKASMMTPTGPDSFQAVLNGNDVYVSSPSFAKRLSTVGKKWIKADLAWLGKATGDGLSALLSRTPADALRQIEGAGAVTRVGPAIIDGVLTTHFRIEQPNVAKLAASVNKVAEKWHVTYGPMDVFVGDEDGYIYSESVSASLSVDGHDANMTVDSDFSKFGEHVSVTPPPASQVLDVVGA